MAEEIRSKNFLEEQIEKDLASGAVKEIMTRFPPEPNGYLHIGHAKAICIDFGLAQQYGGTCNLRYDDTNPAKEDEEFVRSIENDIRWLGFQWDRKLHASDYFDYMYECAEKLITKGLAFVCDLTAEEMREYRGSLTEPGKESPYRNRSVEENLKLFREMRDGKYADGEKVLRAKIDMASPNVNFRDPVIYRIVNAEHHRTGNKWCIYPMYDFAHPLEDAYEGITHSCCTLEFEAHRPLYDWVIENCECESTPHQYEFARLNITRTIMSKRFLKRLVDEKIVTGWDDPRMPTICGLRRRGYTPESIRNFCARVGVAKANSEVEASFLEHCVREDLNEKAPRIMAVLNPLKVVIDNYPEGQTEMMTAENLPGSEETHEVPFSRELYIEQEDFLEEAPNSKWHRLAVGKEVRLKNAYIIECVGVDKDADGKITTVHCTYDPLSKTGDVNANRKVKGTLHWLDAQTAVPAKVRLYDYLLLEDDGTGKDFMERFNHNSLEVLDSFVEPWALEAKAGQQFQFMRMGYFAADEKEFSKENVVFNKIVSLKDSFKKAMK
ncbi:MAG: glutamine--tRNA ligase/YqeY domain fusion protein [Christensenellaceae bacterium]|nr:glutamine--tRNA ligase/YqeY domain fusion protein [Christensenellaceae bacterium]